MEIGQTSSVNEAANTQALFRTNAKIIKKTDLITDG